MSAVRHGAQWASRAPDPQVAPSSTVTTPQPHRSPGPGRAGRVAIVALVALVSSVTLAGVAPSPTRASGDYLLMPRSELLALPVSGTAWSALKSVADGSLGSPDLCDINADHHLRTLGAALVFARTGTSSYGTKARAGIMAAIKTQVTGCGSATLALGRQLAAYVLAADFAGLSGTDDATFRTWLAAIRTKNIGGHAVWNSITTTHKDSANNWGANAGASRIAASLYLGDSADVAAAAKVTQGFLGNRTAWAGFGDRLDSDDLSWSCAGSSSYTPVNKSCTKSGIDVDGGIIMDISRSGSLTWPPGSTAGSYQADSTTAMALQVELLSRNGYGSAWDWSDSAVRRAAQLLVRSAKDGGPGWNETNAGSQAPWLLNKRYGTFLPTRHSAMGRGIGFADWLWGSTSIANLPDPVATTPTVRLSTTSSVPSDGVPVVVGWGLASSSDGLSRYDLQQQKNGGSWTDVKLDSRTSTSYRLTMGATTAYAYRVRAVDRSGRIGDWKAVSPKTVWRVSDSSPSLSWTGNWSMVSSSKYLDGKLHRSSTTDSTLTLIFTGSSIGWVSPKASDHGKAFVYIDGTYVQTVDEYAKSGVSRKVVFADNLGEGHHTFRLKVLGTSGRPKIDMDGLYVIRDK